MVSWNYMIILIMVSIIVFYVCVCFPEPGWRRRLKNWRQASQPIRVWPKKMEVSLVSMATLSIWENHGNAAFQKKN